MRREDNGGVENGDIPMFVDVRWQTQRRGGKRSMIETIPPIASFARAHREGGFPLFAMRVTQEGDPSHSFSVLSIEVILIGMGCSLWGRLPSASASGM
jgi:hypothetical protein